MTSSPIPNIEDDAWFLRDPEDPQKLLSLNPRNNPRMVTLTPDLMSQRLAERTEELRAERMARFRQTPLAANVWFVMATAAIMAGGLGWVFALLDSH